MAGPPSPAHSPEVDFGAFLRPISRNGAARPTSRPASSYAGFPSAPRPIIPSSTQKKLSSQALPRMRQGAPRLGGLGLGGISAASSSSSSFRPLPSPPASPTRNPAPASALPKQDIAAPSHHTQSAAVERPFLSPEMERPPIREGAFALDRPVPELQSSNSSRSATPPSAHDYPSPEPSPSLDLSPPTSPSMDHLGVLARAVDGTGDGAAEPEQEQVSGMLDEVLGMVEAELGTVERGDVGASSSTEEDTSSEDDSENSLSEAEEEEPLRMVETEAESVEPTSLPAVGVTTTPESSPRAPSVASMVSADSFHSLAPPQELEPESSDSEESSEGPLTPPAPAATALPAKAAAVLEDQPSRSIDEVLLSEPVVVTVVEEPLILATAQQSSTELGESSPDLTPPSPRSINMSRTTSRSTSRGRAPPPPRPPRARRPPGSSNSSPVVDTDGFETVAAPVNSPLTQKETIGPLLASHPTHSANSSLSIGTQADDSFFFFPPPTLQRSPPASSPASTSTDPSSPSTTSVTYEGLGLRLPSSIRPRGVAESAQSLNSPPLSPIFDAPNAPAVECTPRPSNVVAPGAASPSPPPLAPAAISDARSPAAVASPPSQTATDTSPSSLTFHTPSPDGSSAPTDRLSVPKSDTGDSALADIGVAVVGAVVSGGMAVGYSAWKGLSAAASAGWGWRAGVPAPVKVEQEQVTTVDREEGEKPDPVDANEMVDVSPRSEAVDEVENSNVATEWGEMDFPAPEGFLEAFKEAMAGLQPEDIAANASAELDAQEAAHELAMQLHREAATTSPTTASLSPTFKPTLPGPHTSGGRASMISPRPTETHGAERGAPDGGDEDDYDELMELVSPLFDSRAQERGSAPRYAPSTELGGGKGFDAGRPLSLTFSGSTQSSTSSRIPPSSFSSSSTLRTPSRPEPTSNKGGFFNSFGARRRRSSIDPPLSPPAAPSSASITSHRRAVSVDSSSSDSFTPSQSAKLKRRSGIFSVSPKASSPPPLPTTPTIESQIIDTTYVSYSTGRSSRRRSSTASSSSSPPPPLPAFPLTSPTSPRRSSIRRASVVSTTSSAIKEKKIYTVRFANADRGIGLRRVAEHEAERAGGDAHAVKWVGVGRGNRYGNLLIQTDAETDEMFAEQVGVIKRKWRFGAQQGEQRDWASVKID